MLLANNFSLSHQEGKEKLFQKLLLCVFLFFGLNSLFADDLPSWVLTPPQSTSEYLFGVGEGSSIKEAKEDALNQIASSISVSIQSSYKMDESLRQSGSTSIYGKDIQNSIKSDVQKIDFSEVELVSNAVYNTRNYLLLKVNRLNLANEKEELLKTNQENLAKKFSGISGQNILFQLKELKPMLKTADETIALAKIATFLDSRIDNKAAIASLQKYGQYNEDLLSQAQFVVVSDGSSRAFADAMKESINAEKIKTSDRIGKNSVVIRITSQSTKSYIYSTYMVKSAVKIELMTPDRVVVSTINKDISGNSSLDYSNATLAAGSSFSDEIKESGVFAYLGIKQ